MAASNNRRWLVIGLVVTLGLMLAAVWPRGGSEDGAGSDAADSDSSAVAEKDTLPRTLPAEPPDGGAKGRRITPDCKPVEESLKYEDFVGSRALAILSWNGMSERAANLKIPVHVVAIEDGSVGVRFMQFPMREQYLGIWLGSGHIESGPKDVFLLDPCSATIVEWPEMERGGDGDEEATGDY